MIINVIYCISVSSVHAAPPTHIRTEYAAPRRHRKKHSKSRKSSEYSRDEISDPEESEAENETIAKSAVVMDQFGRTIPNGSDSDEERKVRREYRRKSTLEVYDKKKWVQHCQISILRHGRQWKKRKVEVYCKIETHRKFGHDIIQLKIEN